MGRYPKFDEEEVLATVVPLYERHTAAGVARILGVHPETITRALKRHGFKVRGPGEVPPKYMPDPIPVVFEADARDWTPYHLTTNLSTTFCGKELPPGFQPGHKMRRLCANCERIDSG